MRPFMLASSLLHPGAKGGTPLVVLALPRRISCHYHHHHHLIVSPKDHQSRRLLSNLVRRAQGGRGFSTTMDLEVVGAEGMMEEEEEDDYEEELYDESWPDNQRSAFRSEDGGPPPRSADYPTLVLNTTLEPLTDYPLSSSPWPYSLRACLQGRVRVLETYDCRVKTGRHVHALPSVVRVKQYVPEKPGDRIVRRAKPYRKYVFLRDGYRCCYCGQSFMYKDLTLDHLIPRCMGGDSSWLNLVTACRRCNCLKGRSAPDDLEKLGMKLLKEPMAPTLEDLQRSFIANQPAHTRKSWLKYLPHHVQQFEEAG